jgi:hypothetical protein
MSRTLQRDLLIILRRAYPQHLHNWPRLDNISDEEIIRNLLYLQEHGLCESGVIFSLDGHASYSGAKITAKGLDFLEDDGGLSAILNTVTVKIHADTLRHLLERKIDASELQPAEKSKLIAALKKLPGKALETATNDLIQQGINNLPNFVEWLSKIVG